MAFGVAEAVASAVPVGLPVALPFLFGCGGSAGGEEEHAAEGEGGAAGECGGLGVVLVGRHLLSIAGGWGAYRVYVPVP